MLVVAGGGGGGATYELLLGAMYGAAEDSEVDVVAEASGLTTA